MQSHDFYLNEKIQQIEQKILERGDKNAPVSNFSLQSDILYFSKNKHLSP